MKTPADQPKLGLGPHRFRVAVTSYYYFDRYKDADRFAQAQAELADDISNNGNLPVLLGGRSYSPGPVYLDDISATEPPLYTATALPPEVYADKANRAGAQGERRAAEDKAADDRLRAAVTGWPPPPRPATVIGLRTVPVPISWALAGLQFALREDPFPRARKLGAYEFLYVAPSTPTLTRLFDPGDVTKPPPYGWTLCFCGGHYVTTGR